MQQSANKTSIYGNVKNAIDSVVASPSFFWLCVFQTTVAILLFTQQILSFVTTNLSPFFWLTPLIYTLSFWQMYRACQSEENRHRFTEGIHRLVWFYRILFTLSVLVIVVAILGFVILSTAPVGFYQKEFDYFFQSRLSSLLDTLYRLFSVVTEGAYYDNFVRTIVMSLLVVGMMASTFMAWIYLLILKMLDTIKCYFEGDKTTCYIPRILIVMCYLMAGFSFALSVLSLSPKGFVMLPIFITMACNYFLLGQVLHNCKTTMCN